jgi:hypothetical protein
MSTQLDLDDVAATSELAKQQLDELRESLTTMTGCAENWYNYLCELKEDFTPYHKLKMSADIIKANKLIYGLNKSQETECNQSE